MKPTQREKHQTALNQSPHLTLALLSNAIPLSLTWVGTEAVASVPELSLQPN